MFVESVWSVVAASRHRRSVHEQERTRVMRHGVSWCWEAADVFVEFASAVVAASRHRRSVHEQRKDQSGLMRHRWSCGQLLCLWSLLGRLVSSQPPPPLCS